MTRLFLPALLLPFACVACFGDDDRGPSPTATVAGVAATATLAPELSPSPTISPATPTPERSTSPLSAVWLYDIESGERLTLFEDAERRIVSVARFDGDAVEVRDRRASIGMWFDLDGNAIPAPTPAPNMYPQCNETSDGAEIDGRVYAGAGCGLISPDQRWMLYKVDASPPEVYPPIWDQWAVNLQSGETRLLQEGLVHCGGCDGRFGPDWSASGRFVSFPELVHDGRTFLHDFETADTRLLFEGSTEITAKPEWSPSEDVILYPGIGRRVMLDDPAAGLSEELSDLRWPVVFDDSGRYVYGPSGEQQTVVYDVNTRAVVATLDGTAWLERPYGRSQRARAVDDTFVALLEWARSCEGAALYRGTDPVACIDVPEPDPYGRDALDSRLRAVLSPDGRWAAVARLVETGDPPPCTENPCSQATIEALYQDPNYNPGWRMSRYEVLLVDTETGDTTVLSDQTFSPAPPQLLWHEKGKHLLVGWPYETGTLGP